MQPSVFNNEDSNPELPAGLRPAVHVPTCRASSPQLQEGKGSLLLRAFGH